MASSQCSTVIHVLCNCNLIPDACSYSHVPHVNQQSDTVKLSPLSFSTAGLHLQEAHFPAAIVICYHNIVVLIMRMIALKLFEMFQLGYRACWLVLAYLSIALTLH